MYTTVTLLILQYIYKLESRSPYTHLFNYTRALTHLLRMRVVKLILWNSSRVNTQILSANKTVRTGPSNWRKDIVKTNFSNKFTGRVWRVFMSDCRVRNSRIYLRPQISEKFQIFQSLILKFLPLNMSNSLHHFSLGRSYIP